MDLPDWMKPHEELWIDFIGHRADKKKPMNERAQKMALRKLERYSKEGCSIVEMLETAVLKNWDGIWPVYIHAKQGQPQFAKPASHKLFEETKPSERSSDEAREKAIREARERMHIVSK